MGTSVEEWSRAFDIMWNNIMSNAAPGITDYEKGVFLTQAQLAIVKDYFSAGANALREGIDDSSRRLGDFAKLIKTSNSAPTNWMFLLDAQVGTNAVVWLSWDEYTRVMQKPYKKPPKGQVWGIVTDGTISIKPSGTISSVRYVATPTPIDLTGTTVTCDLPEHLHDEIIQRAVQLAKIAWIGSAAPQS